MNKINHICKEGIELKRCSRCKKYLPLDNFCKNNRYWDNLNNLCKECESRRRKYSITISKNNVWRNLLKRINNDKNYLKKNVKVNFTETEFKEWYSKHWFAGCVLDRIDNEGNYEFNNIHLITRAEHNKKQREDILKKYNIIEPEGMRYCKNCNQLKPINEFYRKRNRISPYNVLGLDSKCKECNRKARREYYKNKKGSVLLCRVS
jgi:hypothetical protein